MQIIYFIGIQLKTSNYTAQDFLNAIFDIDYLLHKDPQNIIEITRLLANFTLMSSGNNKLATNIQSKLEMLISYIIFYAFMIKSIKNAENLLNSPTLDKTIIKIVNINPKDFLEVSNEVYEEHFYMLRNNCLKIIEETQFDTYSVLISNLIKTKKFKESNYMRGIIHTALFIEKNLFKEDYKKYPFRFIYQ